MDLGFDFKDLHPGVAPDQFCQEALVVGSQVLHQHEGHARIGVGGHSGEEGFERRQPAGGRADADDGETSADSNGVRHGESLGVPRRYGGFRFIFIFLRS